MVTQTDILDLLPAFVAQQLNQPEVKGSGEDLLRHTQTLVEVSREIGIGTNLGEEDLYILEITAWLYDLHRQQPQAPSSNGQVNLLRQFLSENGLGTPGINKVWGCLQAADKPQQPQNVVEEVFCDAVASFLAAPDYMLAAGKQNPGVGQDTVTTYEWLNHQKSLLKKQTFFTRYGKNKFADGVAENLKLIKKQQKALAQENNELAELWEENKNLKKNLAKEKEQKVSRGIETMFRTTMASHLQLSVMADMKANLLISINAIIASIMISSFLRNIDEVPYLIIPSLLLTLVCLLTIIFAVLSTRPNIKATSKQPQAADLLFFGNFVQLTPDAYQSGIRQIMHDHNNLYNAMIDNIYQQGKVLAKKYSLLKLSYSVFMVGFGIVLFSYTIAYLFFAE